MSTVAHNVKWARKYASDAARAIADTGSFAPGSLEAANSIEDAVQKLSTAICCIATAVETMDGEDGA